MSIRAHKTTFAMAVAMTAFGFAFAGPAFAQQGVNGKEPASTEQTSKSSVPDPALQNSDPCRPDDKGKVMPDCKAVAPMPNAGTVDMTAPPPDGSLPKNPQSKATGTEPTGK